MVNFARLQHYQVDTISLDEAKQIAQDFFDKIGSNIAQEQSSVFDEECVYFDEKDRNLWIDREGPTIDYTDFDLMSEEEEMEDSNGILTIQRKENATEQEIREALGKLNITVPEKAEFEENGDGEYRFTTEQLQNENGMYDGSLDCTYMEDGSFMSIYDQIMECKSVGKRKILSEQEAYQQICDGKLEYYNQFEQEIEIGKVKLIYMTDSKGFYQPVYSFASVLDGEEDAILIPAVREER